MSHGTHINIKEITLIHYRSTYKKLTYGDGIVFKFETTEKLQSITITTASITIGVGDSNDFSIHMNLVIPIFTAQRAQQQTVRVGLKMKYYPIFLAPVRTELMDLLEIYLLLS